MMRTVGPYGSTCMAHLGRRFGIEGDLNENASAFIARAPLRTPRLLLCFAIFLVMGTAALGAGLAHAAPPATPDAAIKSIHVVRTGVSTASVVGTTDSPSVAIDVLVNGNVVRTGMTAWIGDYWFLDVPVSDGATVQTRIGSTYSTPAVVPLYVPQPVAPASFIYAQGSTLRLNGSVVQLFGVDEVYVFIYAMIASGLWGPTDPNAWGKNGLFPSGPDGRIGGVADADSLFREYFRYFLHYQQVSGSLQHPKPNVLRIWVADDTWSPDGTYLAWKNNPTAFWNLFDRMVYWAGRAGIYLVPVLGHFSDPKDNTFFTTTSTHYAHQVALVQAIMDRYDTNPRIAMWDLWNEPDVNDDTYWASVGGIIGFKAWASAYIAAVKPHSPNHLITMGIGGWTLFPGVPSFGVEEEFFWNDIPGLEVGHHHAYGTAEDQYLIDWTTDWQKALGRPHFEGEMGYNAWPGPSPLGYGYWPWFAQATRAAGMAAEATMVFMDNGKGPFADYPYLGALPGYPPGDPQPPTDAPPVAQFTYSPSQPAPQQTVTFDGSTSYDPDGSVVSYAWDFGDATTGSGSTATHAFMPAGSYTVTLTVTDNASLTGTATKTVSVTSTDTTPPATITDLRVASTGTNSITLRWTAPGDDGTSGTATWYDFRYATAGPLNDANFWTGVFYTLPFFPHVPGTTEEATVSGLQTGTTYWFAVKSSDEVPNWSGASNSPSGKTGSPNVPPTASFTCSPCSLTVGQTMSVDASGSSDPDGTIVSYAWAFGDGSTATRTTPTAQHIYASAGSYVVALNVTDNGGLSARATKTVTVSPVPPPDLPPTASFTASPANPAVGQTETLDASASTDDHGIASYSWQFGDGGTASGAVVTHAYAAAGDFQVTLVVTDTVGNSGTASSLVHVIAPAPAADTIPPATITDLRIASIGRTYVVLRWTAPGDDGTVGRATSYDLRASGSGPIADASFVSAVHLEISSPKTAGSGEQVVVKGLQAGTRYWFALRASDEVPNWSGTSDTPTAATFSRFGGKAIGGCLICGPDLLVDLSTPEGIGAVLLMTLEFIAVAECLVIAIGLVERRRDSRKRFRRSPAAIGATRVRRSPPR